MRIKKQNGCQDLANMNKNMVLMFTHIRLEKDKDPKLVAKKEHLRLLDRDIII